MAAASVEPTMLLDRVIFIVDILSALLDPL
jgi:hypothetical protein